jgi:1,2-phenylacetyl-CoA epoxidase PaaB subunit
MRHQQESLWLVLDAPIRTRTGQEIESSRRHDRRLFDVGWRGGFGTRSGLVRAETDRQATDALL